MTVQFDDPPYDGALDRDTTSETIANAIHEIDGILEFRGQDTTFRETGTASWNYNSFGGYDVRVVSDSPSRTKWLWVRQGLQGVLDIMMAPPLGGGTGAVAVHFVFRTEYGMLADGWIEHPQAARVLGAAGAALG